MTNVDANLRKAAVLMRSLDADTAAVMLGQLSAEEAAKIRAAMRAVGQVEVEEQADVMAELRGARLPKPAVRSNAVELELSSEVQGRMDEVHAAMPSAPTSGAANTKRFEFLENAPIQALVPHLAREHAQTVAVVLAHLAPERAAAVLAALPERVQTATIDRLSTLGDTDPECVSVLERELQAWAAKRDGLRAGQGQRRDTMAEILAAADAKSRSRILSNMKDHKTAVANQFVPRPATRDSIKPVGHKGHPGVMASRPAAVAPKPVAPKPVAPAPRPVEVQLPRIAFDDLSRLDSRTLSAVLRQVDANVLAIALVDSQESLIDRICDQMPKQTARSFRRELRRVGPTRLSDVEAAQRAVAQIAARQLHEARLALVAARG